MGLPGEPMARNSPLCVWINDLDESRDEFEDLRERLIERTKRSRSATLDHEGVLLVRLEL